MYFFFLRCLFLVLQGLPVVALFLPRFAIFMYPMFFQNWKILAGGMVSFNKNNKNLIVIKIAVIVNIT